MTNLHKDGYQIFANPKLSFTVNRGPFVVFETIIVITPDENGSLFIESAEIGSILRLNYGGTEFDFEKSTDENSAFQLCLRFYDSIGMNIYELGSRELDKYISNMSAQDILDKYTDIAKVSRQHKLNFYGPK